MKKKYDSGLVKNSRPVSLHLLLENDIKALTAFSEEELLDIDKFIHDSRKSLKAISAVLLLFKPQLDKLQYVHWRSYFKEISKKYATLREPYIYIQTFNQVLEDLENTDKHNLLQLKNHLELNYKLLVKENGEIKETIGEFRKSTLEISATIHSLEIIADLKLLKQRRWKIFKKTMQLFEKLTLASTAEDFHKFRKWSRYFYFQLKVFNLLGLEKVPLKEVKRLHKVTTYLGDEHDLQLFYQYLRKQHPNVFGIVEPFLLLKINKLRRKVMELYPKV